MLSVITCYSLYVLVAVAFFCLCVAPEIGDQLTKLPPLRLRLWIVAILIAAFAIDFSVVVRFREYSASVRLQTCAFDVAVVGVPIAVHKWRRQTVLDLWTIACLVGLVGTLAIPSITAR